MRIRVRLSLPAALAAAPLLLSAPPPAGPQTFQGPPREGRDYVYAGSRLLAVADPTQASVMVELPAEPLAIPEGGGPRTVPLRVTTLKGEPTPSPVTITYDTSGGSAVAGADYAPFGGEIVVPAGTASGATVALTLTPIDDAVDEADETITIALRSTEGAVATRPVQEVFLVDDDDPPSLSVGDVAGAEDSGALVFAVSLSAPSEREVSVRYETRDGSAEAGRDFTPAAGVLSIPAGATTGAVVVALEPDRACEGPETFRLVLGAPAGATLARAEATGTIGDDDPPTIAVSDAVGVEADDVAARAVFRVDLLCPAAEPVSVDYRTADAAARSGTDYVAASGTLVLPAGASSARLAVQIVPDGAREPARDFRLLLANPAGGGLDRAAARATLRDNDGAPVVAGDFDRDGHADLLARPGADGATAVWRMQGATRTGLAALPSPAGAGWEAAATLDADGDGSTDVVWWNRDTREAALWLMDGLALRASAALPETGEWAIAGAADVNRDGRADPLLWAEDPAAGVVATKAWILDGPGVAAEAAGPAFPAGSRIDLVLPGRAGGYDVLWSDGPGFYRTMVGADGAPLDGLQPLWSAPWRLAAAADLDRDGRVDLVWQHETTGEVRVAFDPDDTPETAALLDLPEDSGARLVGPR